MAKKKNIKREKFSSFTFLILASVLAGLIISLWIKIYFHEYIPQTNLYGETGLIKEPRTPIPYNEGDFFRPLFGIALWIYSTIIVVFLINIFRKNFAYNLIRLFDYYELKKDKRYIFWLFLLIGFPVMFAIFVIFLYGIIHLINYQFNTSLSERWGVVLWFLVIILIGFVSDKLNK
tara:strand:- start:57 stop:584 length:528 start_codon:yes stop_codon:yes gene_type:complete